jgi:hypothetical protein
MDDVKKTYREGENRVKEAARDVDGRTLADDIGNAGDDVRQDIGNLGDEMRRQGDEAEDELDRRF